MVDFYLAGSVDGFAKSLFTSFIWATMRRNLLCCRPGAFVQARLPLRVWRARRAVPQRRRTLCRACFHDPTRVSRWRVRAQWMAWYNLTRSHRDKPMLDAAFMHALETTHEDANEQEQEGRAAAESDDEMLLAEA